LQPQNQQTIFFSRRPWPKEDQKRREPRSLRPSARNATLLRKEVPTSRDLIFTASSDVNPEWPTDTPTPVPTRSRALHGEKILSLTTWRTLRSTSRYVIKDSRMRYLCLWIQNLVMRCRRDSSTLFVGALSLENWNEPVVARLRFEKHIASVGAPIPEHLLTRVSQHFNILSKLAVGSHIFT